MNSTIIFAQLLHLLWFLVPILLLVVLFKSMWFVDTMGEFVLDKNIKRNLDPNKFHLLQNVTIPCEEGSMQIDRVLVSRYGIFVLETMNLKGWIFGDVHQKSWIQQIYRNKTKFQNPLHQNGIHVKAFQQLLGVSNEQIHSLIVFVGKSTFKTEMPENVTREKEYLNFIRSKKDMVLSEYEVHEFISKIKNERLEPSLKTHSAHVRHGKDRVNAKQNSIVSMEIRL